MSKLKMFWKWLTGGKQAVFEYLVDVANTYVQSILTDENKAKVASVREVLAKINETLMLYRAYIPESWMTYAAPINDVLTEIYTATADNALTTDELTAIGAKWSAAYAAFKAD